MPVKKEYRQIAKVWNNNLGVYFEDVLSDDGFPDTLQFIIDTCTGTLPAPSTVNLLIFQLLMKNHKSLKLDEVGVFLQYLLETIPSKNLASFYDYKAAVLDQKGIFPDLWSILVHLVKSSFSHYGINVHESDYQPQLVKHPTCDFLIHFYVEYSSKFLSLEKDLFIYSSRRRDLIQWINTLYKFNLEQVEILKDLHNLLDEAVNCEIMSNTSYSISVALNHPLVFDVATEIFTICKDVFTSYNKFLQFLRYSKLGYLSANICQHTLCGITESKRLPKTIPLTLKELIRCFFFISLSSEKKRRKPPVFFMESQRTYLNKRQCKERVKKVHVQSLVMGDRLKPLNIAAVDKQHCTPLHYAVMSDDKSIVKLLLQHEGEDLLHKKDCYNLKLHEYAVSQNMPDLLKNIYTSFSLENGELDDHNKEEFEISYLYCYDNYSLYLYALHSLLCYYFDIFRLHNFRGNAVFVEDHNKLSCSHFSSSSVYVACVEDYSVLQSLPKYMEELIERVEEDAKKFRIDIKREVRLLKLFSTTLAK